MVPAVRVETRATPRLPPIEGHGAPSSPRGADCAAHRRPPPPIRAVGECPADAGAAKRIGAPATPGASSPPTPGCPATLRHIGLREPVHRGPSKRAPPRPPPPPARPASTSPAAEPPPPGHREPPPLPPPNSASTLASPPRAAEVPPPACTVISMTQDTWPPPGALGGAHGDPVGFWSAQGGTGHRPRALPRSHDPARLPAGVAAGHPSLRSPPAWIRRLADRSKAQACLAGGRDGD